MNQRSLFFAFASLLLLAAAGCKQKSYEEKWNPKEHEMSASTSAGWSVFNPKGREVERIWDRPGRLTSTALPPPGVKPVTHPFIAATALDPMEEDNLYQLLNKSRDFEDYVKNLKQAGYDVRPRKTSH